MMHAHPAADIFPMMAEAELASLAEDIKQHGQSLPIITIVENDETLILDGRNRARACEMAGVAPVTIPYGGEDPFSFVVSANLKRRHLSINERAMLSAQVDRLRHGANRHRKLDAARAASSPTTAETAGLFEISSDSVQRARVIADQGCSELVAAVRSSEVSLKAGAKLARMPKEEQRSRLQVGDIPKDKPASQPKSEPRLVVHNGGVMAETRKSVFQSQRQKMYDLSAKPQWRTRHEDHAAVLRCLEKNMRFADVVEATGFDDHFVHHSMAPYRVRARVMDKIIVDMQATAESWASWARRLDEKWPNASREEKDALIEQLEACRRSAGAFIRELKKDARNERETG